MLAQSFETQNDVSSLHRRGKPPNAGMCQCKALLSKKQKRPACTTFDAYFKRLNILHHLYHIVITFLVLRYVSSPIVIRLFTPFVLYTLYRCIYLLAVFGSYLALAILYDNFWDRRTITTALLAIESLS